MKKVAIAVVAAFMSMAFAGAYAAEDMKKADKSKGDAMKSDTAKEKMDMKADKSKKKEEKK